MAHQLPSSRVETFCRMVLAAVLLGMVALNVVNVLARHGLSTSIRGADEILIFAMVWLVFAGAAFVSWQDKHLRFPALFDALQGSVKRVLSIVTAFSLVGLFAFTAHASWTVIEKLDRIGQKSMAVGLPMTVPHSALLFCFTAMALIALLSCVRLLKRRPPVGQADK